jgi:hypothetical protein
MNSTRIQLLLALVMLVTPVPLLAQQHGQAHPAPSAVGATMARHAPLANLLRDREALGLSALQVTQLEQIERQLIERNRPLVEDLLRIRRGMGEAHRVRPNEMSPEQRQRWERMIAEARPIMHQIRRHNRDAMEEVGRVLSQDQREMLRQRLAAQRDSARERGNSRREGGERRERGEIGRGRPR